MITMRQDISRKQVLDTGVAGKAFLQLERSVGLWFGIVAALFLVFKKKNQNSQHPSHRTGSGLNWTKFEVTGSNSLQKNVFWVNPALKPIIV